MLSIIMPARNEQLFIASAIGSVLAQLPLSMPLDLIVVDDGSTDNTSAIVAGFVSGGARVRLITATGKGVSAARNLGLSALGPDTTIVGFLDADDMVPPGRFARDLALFATDPLLEVVYGKLRLVTGETANLVEHLDEADPVMMGISVSTGLYRAETLARVGLFDTGYDLSEDFDFLLRLFERRPATHLLADEVVWYRQHPGNTTAGRPDLRRAFMRAMLGHAKRLAANPDLAPVDWIWSKDALAIGGP